MYSSPRARQQEIELGATLRPQALRSLCEHAAIELDVRWRDLPADHWQYPVVTAQGRHVPVSETLWMRTREVWLHAVDLRVGLRVRDIPDPVKSRLLDDVVGLWSRRGEAVTWRLVESGGAARTWGASSGPDVAQISGDLAGLLAWATGRGKGGHLTWTDGHPQPAPRWL